MKVKQVFRVAASIALMAGVLWFFWSQVRRHWDQLENLHLQFSWPAMSLALALVLIHYLIATLAWRTVIVGKGGQPLTIRQSIGLSNISQLTKYVPGKVWSYAIQMHLLSAHGISKSRVLSVNVIMLLSLAASSTVIGTGYLRFSGTLLPRQLSALIFAAALTAYLLLVFGGTWTTNLLVRLINRLLRRRIDTFDAPLTTMIRAHGLNLLSNLLYGISGYFVAVGIGMPGNLSLVIPISAAMLLSDTVGFFVFLAPGGIGVRESVMYAMLKSIVDIQTCFVLPIAFRLVTTVNDLILGGTAAALLNRFAKDSARRRIADDIQP